MTGTIRSRNITAKAGILAVVLFAAAFASVQVACLTHMHCEGAGCLDRLVGSGEGPGHGYHEDGGAHGECGGEAEHACEDGSHRHDVHHHSHDGRTHPPKRFTVPVLYAEFTDTAPGETPVLELAALTAPAEDPPPLERFGPIFAERAPPRA